MMILVRLIDLVVSMLRILFSPDARLLRAGVLMVLACGALVAGVGLFWLLAQLPQFFASP